MKNQPCYVSADDNNIKLFRTMAAVGLPMSLLGQLIATLRVDLNIPIAMLRYVFGPLVIHVPPGTPSGDMAWLDRKTIDRWKPRVYVERLEILCGEVPDIVSATEIWLVTTNALHEAPPRHQLAEVVLWAANRALIRSGQENPLTKADNTYRLASDEDVIEGNYSMEYRELSRQIIAKVIAHSQIERRPRRAAAAE
jgi:hypothetical protein